MRERKYILVKIAKPPIMAPCRPDGEVLTTNENKEAICSCFMGQCLVDARNYVLEPPNVEDYEIWPVR